MTWLHHAVCKAGLLFARLILFVLFYPRSAMGSKRKRGGSTSNETEASTAGGAEHTHSADAEAAVLNTQLEEEMLKLLRARKAGSTC